MPTSAWAVLHHTDQNGPNILKGSVSIQIQYIILGFDTELQIINGKQYTDITADDFSKFIEYISINVN